MKKFEKVSIIKNCDIEQLFDFHLDADNLKEITPPDTKVKILNTNFIAKRGEILKIRTTKYFIPTYWKVEIKKLEKPNLLIDVALKSPFKFWEHHHIFTKKGNVCELKDVVNYKLPFGKLGELLDFFIKNQLKEMFDYRHERTKEILESRIKPS